MSGEYRWFVKQPQLKLGSLACRLLFLPLFVLAGTSMLSGQSIKEFKEIWVNESREYLLNNQKPLPYLQSGFHHFSREQDNSLTEGLESEWLKFNVVPPSPVPKSRKYDPAPQFHFDETSYHTPMVLSCYTVEKSENELEAGIIHLPRIRKPEYTSSNPLKLNFNFYGNPISLTYDKLLILSVNQFISKEGVTDYWRKFQIANSHHLINQLMIFRDRLGLGDWGYFLLVKSCASALFPEDETNSTLLSWALMIRSGFNLKIGYNQLGASILYTSNSKIYGIPSVKINGSIYYIDKSISSFPITSYTGLHPGATRSIQLRINQSLNFQGEILTKKIQFSWDKKMHDFNLKYNPEIINFLESYPQTDPQLYFSAPFSATALEPILKQFRQILTGMRKEEGAAFLQQFVQKAIGYRPYNDIFGYDRFMFPEEVFFKDESNDKGKALLYAWMVAHLLNEKAALVEFPGFFSTAISLEHSLEGDNFFVNGRSYTVADPTYDKAPIGLLMKEFLNSKPFVMPLYDVSDIETQQNKIWKLAMAFGAERSGAGKDFLMDEDGNSYITGYFKEKLTPNSLPAPFVAKFNGQDRLVWMEKIHSKGKAFGLELKQLDKNELYLAGSFRGELFYKDQKIQTLSGEPDLFFAQFNRDGEIGWMCKCGIDELEEDTGMFYVVRFTRSGEIQSVQLSNEDERSGETGFNQISSEGLSYISSRFQSTGLDKPVEVTIPNPVSSFRLSLNRMKQLGLEPTTASIAALFNALLNNGNKLTNSDLVSLRQGILDQGHNASLNLTEIIPRIRLLKNSDGIVEILTTDSNPLSILPFKVFNKSHFKILLLDNNDLKIKVIDGIEYEAGFIRGKVNSILTDLSNGSLIIDVGINHQISTRSLRQNK